MTGGSGFIGSHVVDGLLDGGLGRVVVFDKVVREANLAGGERPRRGRRGRRQRPGRVAAATAGIDGVFHMAVLPLGPTVENPRLGLDVNVVGTFNVFEAAHDAGVQKVVFSSASSVYGDTDDTMDESHPLGARTMYGASKIAGEYFLRSFNDQYGLPYVTLRYMNVYGPRQEGGLVMAVARRVLAGEAPTITGDGSQSFDFVHVADVAGANVAAMASDVSARGVQRRQRQRSVGAGRSPRSSSTFVGADVRGSATDPSVRVLMKRRVGSNEKAKSSPRLGGGDRLDEGLRDTVEWIRAATS